MLGGAPLQQHVDHAAAFVDAGGAASFVNARVLDLGSGGGIPGLVIAARCSSAHVTLLDGRTQRVDFLEHAVERLGWSGRVEVLGARAEDVGRDPERRGAYDVVVARGFGRPAVTAECAAPLLRVGGLLVVSEPPDAPDNDPRWPAEGCALVGMALRSLQALPWSFALLCQELPCPDRYPRRVGVPAKRPLF
ncbi:MAG: rRNA small subunit methyltransferase [Acidimicrobiaceae bacterium]|nr:rRNA small subunit methyltransferase [Acidimicrobiaceae bacterium]